MDTGKLRSIYQAKHIDKLLRDATEGLEFLEKLVPAEPQQELYRMEMEEVPHGQPDQAVAKLLRDAFSANENAIQYQAENDARAAGRIIHFWHRTGKEDEVELEEGRSRCTGTH